MSQQQYDFPLPASGLQKNDLILGVQNNDDDQFEQGKLSAVSLKNGPSKDRKCHDLIYFIIFTLFLLYYFLIFSNIFKHENKIQEFITPRDPDHRACGKKTLKEYPFIYFANPDKNYLTNTVCIKQCPNNLQKNMEGQKIECATNSNVKSCIYNNSHYPNQTFLIYETFLKDTVCVPKEITYQKQIETAIYINEIQNYIFQIYIALAIIGLSALLSFIFGPTRKILYQKQTLVFIRLQNILFINCNFMLDLWSSCIFNSSLFKLKNKTHFLLTKSNLFQIIFTLIFFFNIKLAANFIQQNKMILIIPPILFIVLLSFFCFWVDVCFNILSHGYTIDTQNQLPFQQIQLSTHQYFKLTLHAFFFLVFRGFLVQCSDFIITYSCCQWYYKKEKDTQNVIWQNNIISQQQQKTRVSIKTLVKYHLGSLIISSIVVTFLDYFIRIGNLINVKINQKIYTKLENKIKKNYAKKIQKLQRKIQPIIYLFVANALFFGLTDI
ncbi:hypothetical protein IMG5_010560 [Ichthyophthirius multifiliis]|uniref:Choline transporter-like protein n=1 Tax=Ichthyophthirius multifiliis TaxID=5932 RepID=G0QJY7_ICHMU|nr:hypothetical protein IMG5_010560 [Ichthyophthirius multifiliis]EGR34468.1 hypothetical protein IMG5_010560 [Ichthyophthirius multifiliis]|eukprot:XP_004039772.1 hypothetical protein IMG5_010560 [Ichthyophthirius multifiliis]